LALGVTAAVGVLAGLAAGLAVATGGVFGGAALALSRPSNTTIIIDGSRKALRAD
jgi:hypothetical protein